MSQDLDTADVLSNMLPPSFPPAARRSVFLPGGPDAELLADWGRWGGEGIIIYDDTRAPECGICLFRRGELGGRTAENFFKLVQPFFTKGGDVFQYFVEERTFRRISDYEFGLYYTPRSEG